jgi:hypothetical protein
MLQNCGKNAPADAVDKSCGCFFMWKQLRHAGIDMATAVRSNGTEL